ncbi:rhomboid family protein [Streptomyces sp. Ag109_O5-1]|uniref:rhomboid family intramembrane serine protease n=1 Tax=Streptomyces sp. Ag109_O5-1 TaxID=1938851 RepID=UPI000F4E1A1E|nr:rhomboid family intramembrane serine protease [Streptomyces sp. Ag109_O5-1]RPE44093.1 rhomboid family protein [Streptomyces sp. Ag109_O5-1]
MGPQHRDRTGVRNRDRTGVRNRDRTGGTTAGPEQLIAEARKAFFVMFALLAVVWLVQLANYADHYALSRDYAVVSGDVGTLPDILVAPLLHWSWAHIESNSGPLFVFGFLAAYRGVVRFLGLTLLIALSSGVVVWFFERDDVATVGASGLIFGYFGYVVVRGLFDRHLIDTLVGIVMGASFAYLLTVAVPGTPGVSWLGHLGGLLGGLAGAWLFRDRHTRTATGDATVPTTAGTARTTAGTTPRTPAGSPRADLYKELDDLGLL